jgi:hypothetical protein
MKTTFIFINFFIVMTIIFSSTLYSQRNCGTQSYQNENLKKFPQLKGRFNTTFYTVARFEKLRKFDQIVTIPVVVHVVYKKNDENISDIKIQNQLKTLNDDFAGSNADIGNMPDFFKKNRAGDCKIRFKLAAITRTKTYSDVFYLSDDNIKYTETGGISAGQFPTNKFLNIWVGNISKNAPDDLYGYSPYPGQAPSNEDGVVIHYKCFSSPGMLTNLDRGRTATHEVGHWLGLRHLWGETDDDDADCDDDGISDTPMQQFSNGGCPRFPKLSDCSTTAEGEMFVNYMDYVYDRCMVMFSEKQKERMRSNFIDGGPRADIILGNSENLIASDNSLINSASPVINKFENGKLTWSSSAPAENYTVKLKSIDSEKTFTYTTTKNALNIEGLDPTKVYEIIIDANNDETVTSSPLLVQTNEKQSEIIFKEQ